MSDENGLTEIFTFRLSKRDLALLEKITTLRGEDQSTFIKRMMRRGFAELGFLEKNEKKALGVTV